MTVPDSPFCRAYLDHTFRDADVVELLGAVVPVHILCSDEEETAAKLDVAGFPYVLILDEELKVKKRMAGYRHAQKFVQDIKSVLP